MNVVYKPSSLQVGIDAKGATAVIGQPIAREYVELPPYEGETTITPSSETQVLHTKNFRMTANVTVNPIPSNYGLITWNGSIITVS